MPQTLDQAVQNAYSDLYVACLTPAFDGKGVSFTRKNIKGQRYIYISTKVGQTPVQKYIGRVIGYSARFGIGCRRSRQAGRRQIPSTV